MFKRNEFRAVLARKDMTIETIAKALNISASSVSRKMNGRSDFFRYEIEKISELLELSSDEILNIFFA